MSTWTDIGIEDLKKELSSGLAYSIAAHLETVLMSTSKKALDEYKLQLSDLFQRVLRESSSEAAEAARGSSTIQNSALEAYHLGQLGFAQLLAAQAADRRPDDDFQDTLFDPAVSNYIKQLLNHNLTNVELVSLTGENASTVSRKLRVLREFGITDFRKAGNRVVNFLTPAARTYAQTRYEASSDSLKDFKESEWLTGLMEDLEPFWQAQMDFGSPQVMANDRRFALAA